MSEKVDIWMLGCVLYTICYYVNPFQEASTLAITQADFKVPPSKVTGTTPMRPQYSPKMVQLIKLMLTPDPKERPSIFEIDYVVKHFDKIPSIGRPTLPPPTAKTNDEISLYHSCNTHTHT